MSGTVCICSPYIPVLSPGRQPQVPTEWVPLMISFNLRKSPGRCVLPFIHFPDEMYKEMNHWPEVTEVACGRAGT